MVAVIVPLQVLMAVLAWRDMDRREDDRIRGPRLLWRVVVCLNPGNALAYWLLGRR